MCIGIIWNNSFFLVGGRARAEARINPRPLRTSLSTAHKLHPGPCSSGGMQRGTDIYTHTDTERHAWPIYTLPGRSVYEVSSVYASHKNVTISINLAKWRENNAINILLTTGKIWEQWVNEASNLHFLTTLPCLMEAIKIHWRIRIVWWRSNIIWILRKTNIHMFCSRWWHWQVSNSLRMYWWWAKLNITP